MIKTSVTSRYLSKFGNNFIALSVNVLSAFIVPKALGPAHYGDLNFLRDTFQQIVQFLDLNLASAHFNYSSRYVHSQNATRIYFYFCLAVGLFLFLCTSAACITGLSNWLWPKQSTYYVLAGMCLAYLLFLADKCIQLSDSKEKTVGSEIRRVASVTIGFGILLLLFYSGVLDLSTFFGLSIFIQGLLVVLLVSFLRKMNTFDFRFCRVEKTEVKKIINYFWSYSHPLLFASFFGLLFNYFDRWFLQIVSGSASQGYYSLALRLSTICFLFTGAISPILQQGVAKAHGENDLERIRYFFDKVRIFYFIACFFALFFIFQTKEIISLIGKAEYSEANIPLMIMMLYPVHQTYGQLAGGIMVSMGRTDIYRNISLLCSPIGFIVCYFLVAPHDFSLPGLGLGATGLALKAVIVQIISVNIILYFVCKLVGRLFLRSLVAQIFPFIVLFPIAYGSAIVKDSLLFSQQSMVTVLFGVFLSGFLYFSSAVILCCLFPGLLGLKREEMNAYRGTLFDHMMRRL